MGVRAKARRPLEVLKLYAKESVGVDGLGEEIYEFKFLTLAGGHIERLTGSRLSFYKKMGYTKPIEIEMYDQPFDRIVLQSSGEVVEVQSVDTMSNNRLKVKVIGDIIDVK